MASKIGKVIFLLLGAGVIFYVLRSGIVGKSISTLNPHSTSSTSSSGGGLFGFLGFHLAGTSSPTYYSGTGNNYETSGSNNNNNGQPTINPADIPAGFTASQLSPSFHMVRIGSASYGYYGSYGTISLYASNLPNASTTLDITGWQIKATHGGVFVPQAINNYDPSGLTPPSDIIFHQGDNLYLYTTNGPFNLRLNACIGYVGKNNKTNPQIPSYCAGPNLSAISNFTGKCQNYIYSIGGCTTPDLNNPNIPFNDDACRNFIANNYTYRSCYDAHSTDPNFLSNQIWAWIGSNVVDQYHDKVQLLDRNGLLVDIYNY